jgi:flagellar biosynthesis/type III secretory pathway chaperone
VEKNLAQIQQILQKLIGLHRQLLDTVRSERDALVQADVKSLQDAVYAKEALVEAIRSAEGERLKQVAVLAVTLKKPLKDLTLSQIAIEIQGRDLKQADALRSALNALVILVERIREQNTYNKGLVERSLENVNQMKRNVLGESSPTGSTYTKGGQRSGSKGNSRLISKEA